MPTELPLPYVPIDPCIEESDRFLDFVDAADIHDQDQALLYITKLLLFAGRKHVDGCLGFINPRRLAMRCAWPGDPNAFLDAIVASRWLTRMDDGRFCIEGWERHGGRVYADRVRHRKNFKQHTSSRRPPGGTPEPPVVLPPKGEHEEEITAAPAAKQSTSKQTQAAAAAIAGMTIGAAAARFLQHAREAGLGDHPRNRPLTPASRKLLEDLQPTDAELREWVGQARARMGEVSSLPGWVLGCIKREREKAAAPPKDSDKPTAAAVSTPEEREAFVAELRRLQPDCMAHARDMGWFIKHSIQPAEVAAMLPDHDMSIDAVTHAIRAREAAGSPEGAATHGSDTRPPTPLRKAVRAERSASDMPGKADFTAFLARHMLNGGV